MGSVAGVTGVDLTRITARPGPRVFASMSSADVAGLNIAPWPKVNFERYGEIEQRFPDLRTREVVVGAGVMVKF